LHALILRDRARAAEIISHLNQQQLGQAALVLERIAHRDRPASNDLPQSAIGWAADNVRTPAPLEVLVKGLLHNVALFENFQEAQLAQTASASKISQLEREQHSAERELESLEFERSTLERQIAAADAQIQQLEVQGAELEEKIARDRKEAALLQTQRDEALRE